MLICCWFYIYVPHCKLFYWFVLMKACKYYNCSIKYTFNTSIISVLSYDQPQKEVFYIAIKQQTGLLKYSKIQIIPKCNWFWLVCFRSYRDEAEHQDEWQRFRVSQLHVLWLQQAHLVSPCHHQPHNVIVNSVVVFQYRLLGSPKLNVLLGTLAKII